MAPINVGVLILDNKPAATASASEKCCSVCIRGTKSRQTLQLSGPETTIGFCTSHLSERLVGKLNLEVLGGLFRGIIISKNFYCCKMVSTTET